jgi:nitrilase
MGNRYAQLKVAAVQAAPIFLDRDASTEKVCRLIEEAGKNGASLIVFPECFIPGYPYWYSFYHAFHPVVTRCNREMLKNSVEIPSECTTQLCQAAKKANAYVVMGIDEARPGMIGTIYNSMLFIHRDGSILGKHQKLKPSGTERIVHGLGDGSTLCTFPSEFGPIGGLCCGENGNPLFRFALLCQGEVIHAANWPVYIDGIAHETMLHRAKNYAFEGKVFVISAAGFLSEEMLDLMEADESMRTSIKGRGGYLAIFGPTGNYLAGPAYSGETIIYADIDLEQIIDARILQDFTGHYNRFDVVSLNYNDSPNTPVRYGIPTKESTNPDTVVKSQTEDDQII